METKLIRKSSHAGSWYEESQLALTQNIEEMLLQPEVLQIVQSLTMVKKLKALIVPHAGYMWSGPTAAFSYALLSNHLDGVKTIFVLGNSHFQHFTGLGCSGCSILQTPLGDLKVDKEIS